MPDTKFIFIKQDMQIHGKVLQQFSVGIVKNETGNGANIQFVCFDVTVYVSWGYYDFFNPDETGDYHAQKVCNICHRLLPVENFAPNQKRMIDASIIRRPSCDGCRKDIDGVPMKRSEKIKWEKEKPDLRFFTCPICLKKTIPGLTSKVVLDHNHDDGTARGWICDSCNTGIGRFKDNIELMESAIKYLQTK